MSAFPKNLKYAKSHEWARLEENGTVSVGITDYAQESLGDIVYVELPEPGSQLIQGQEAGTIESVKAASEFYTPIAGTVEAINEALEDAPEVINADCYESGWLIRVKPDDSVVFDHLLTADAYQKICD